MTSYNNSHNNILSAHLAYFSLLDIKFSQYILPIEQRQHNYNLKYIITTCFDISSIKIKRLMQGCSVLFLLAESRRTLQGPAKRQLYRYLLSKGLHNRIEGICQTQIGRRRCHVTSL